MSAAMAGRRDTGLSLGLRLALGFLLVALLPLAGLAWFYLHSAETALTSTVLQNIASIADKKSDQIDSYLNERLADARTQAGQARVQQALRALSADFARGGMAATVASAQQHRAELARLAERSDYHDLLLIDAGGQVLFALRGEADLGSNLLHGPYSGSALAAGFRQAMRFLHIDLSRFEPYAPSAGEVSAFAVAPVLIEGRPIGALALQIKLATLAPVVMDRTGLGRSGETVLGYPDGERIVYAVPLLRPLPQPLPGGQALDRSDPRSALMRRALSGESGRGMVLDYAGVETAASWHYLPALGWGMVVKMDAAEVLAPSRSRQGLTLLAFALFLLLSGLSALLLGRQVLRSERVLQQSLAELRAAQRIARLGSWTLDLRDDSLQWSDEVFRIFEIDAQRFGARYEDFLAAIHPEDRERVERAFREALAQRRPYEVSHRLLFADGRIKHVHEHGQTDYDAQGQALRTRGTVQDISELRRTEEALQLYANIFQHSGEAILVTDAAQRIIAVNPAFSRQTGYSLAEVQGRDPSLLASGRTPRSTYQAMWEALGSRGYWQGELWDRDRDGKVYPKWAAISAIRDDGGAVSHYIASFIDISERKAAEARIEHLAHHDALTGLFNRYNLQIRLSQALLSAHREGHCVAVVFIDLDRFKLINDTLGHHTGDLLLVEVARRLQGCVRESDIVARLGGDEFVVVLAGLERPGDASAVAGKILQALDQPYLIAGERLHSSASLGISVYPQDGADVVELMRAADTAMYHAKSQGRNNLQYFTAALNADADERLTLERELRLGLEQGQFELHYQPQFAPAADTTAVPVAMEALLRWRHPRMGMVPPLRFIPIAEETGLIEPLGLWVLEQACRQLAQWRREGAAPARIAVNLSAHQLRNPALALDIARILKEQGLAGAELELEITESVAMRDPAGAVERLQELRALGLTLAIDDFGTGYSSLVYLKRLPIQVLKLDREFVRDIENDDNDAAISAATLALAHSLGLLVVAEGIETVAQHEFLLAHGCDLLQGYLLGRPEPAAYWTALWAGPH